MRIRPYQSVDRDGCIALFESNVPLFFLPREVAGFARFLDALPCPYRVVERGAAIIACGGYDINPQTGIARLDWGMVRRDLHKRKIGRFLLQARLAEIAADPTATKVALNTSQHSRGFFEREGFTLRAIVPDAYGPVTWCHFHGQSNSLNWAARKESSYGRKGKEARSAGSRRPAGVHGRVSPRGRADAAGWPHGSVGR